MSENRIKRILLVIDVQNDFVTGNAGSENAKATLPAMVRKIYEYKQRNDLIIVTQDTHDDGFWGTQESKFFPIEHCKKGTDGWELAPEIRAELLGYDNYRIIEKETFGSIELAEMVRAENPDEVELIGLVSSICIVTNALLLKTYIPETPILVDAQCTTGITKADYDASLTTMEMCHVQIINK